MKIKTEVLPADKAESIAKAAELLRSGELVALPTETVYGIAADASNGEDLWQKLVRPASNIELVVCGHISGSGFRTPHRFSLGRPQIHRAYAVPHGRRRHRPFRRMHFLRRFRPSQPI